MESPLDRQHQALLEGLLSNELFVESIGRAIENETFDLTKKLRAAVRDGNISTAADLGGQISGLERIIPILKRVVGKS